MKAYKKVVTCFAAMLIAALIIGLMPRPSQAAYQLTDQIKTKHGIRYAITGVGESKDDPRWAAFSLKIVLATTSGALFSDADITIRAGGPDGKKVISVKKAFPWLVVDLPPGTYFIEAKGPTTQTAIVTVYEGRQTEHTFKW